MEESTTRRLAAIVAADVAGYSRLMSSDEEGTLARENGEIDQAQGQFLAPDAARIQVKI